MQAAVPPWLRPGSPGNTALLLLSGSSLQGIPLLFFDSTEKIDAYASRISTKKALLLINAAEALAEKLKFYLDMRLAAVTFCADARKINTK